MNRRLVKSLILFFAGLAIAVASTQSSAETPACTKPKVAVKLSNFYKEAYDVLIRQYPFQTKEYWTEQIQNKMLEKLRANSPGVSIFSAGSASDYDYYIKYNVAVIACGEKEKIGDLVSNKDTCYWVTGMLYSQDGCGISGVGFQSADIQYKDIYTAVTLFALQMGNLDTVTAKHEKERPIPPRGPRISVNPPKQSVSPLEGERETFIDAQVTNCRGEPVYDKVGKRFGVIAGPKESSRGETHPILQHDFREAANAWNISPTEQGKVTLRYTLKKGIRAAKEKINYIACGLGTKANGYGEISIDGLEISVRPQKPVIKPGESTTVAVGFFKVSANGQKTPVPGKEIQLKFEGLKDGVITPRDRATTDQNGGFTLTYQSGQNDKSVRIRASYQPQNFPDKAEGSAAINIQEGKGDMEVDVRASVNWVHDYAEHRVSLVTNIAFAGTMTLDAEKHAGAYQRYKIQNMQMTYSHHFKAVKRKPDRDCPETLDMEVQGAGTMPVTGKRLTIRYPRESRRANRTGIDFSFAQNFPVKVKTLSGGKGCYHTTLDSFGFGDVTVEDSKAVERMDQKEFSGSFSFGIDPTSDPFRYFRGTIFYYTDYAPAGITATLPTETQAKEIEKILESGDPKNLEKLMNRSFGLVKGHDAKITWRFKKIAPSTKSP